MKVLDNLGVAVSAGPRTPHYTRGEKDWKIDVTVVALDGEGKLTDERSVVPTYHKPFVAKPPKDEWSDKEKKDFSDEQNAHRRASMEGMDDAAIEAALKKLGIGAKPEPKVPAKK